MLNSPVLSQVYVAQVHVSGAADLAAGLVGHAGGLGRRDRLPQADPSRAPRRRGGDGSHIHPARWPSL